MIDEFVYLVLAATVDAVTARAARRHRWIRTIQAIVLVLFVALLVAAIYLTFKYA